MHACKNACIHTYIHTHIHTYIHIHPSIHTYIHTYLHYITLHYISLHYITLRYITLHYVTYIHICIPIHTNTSIHTIHTMHTMHTMRAIHTIHTIHPIHTSHAYIHHMHTCIHAYMHTFIFIYIYIDIWYIDLHGESVPISCQYGDGQRGERSGPPLCSQPKQCRPSTGWRMELWCRGKDSKVLSPVAMVTIWPFSHPRMINYDKIMTCRYVPAKNMYDTCRFV